MSGGGSLHRRICRGPEKITNITQRKTQIGGYGKVCVAIRTQDGPDRAHFACPRKNVGRIIADRQIAIDR